MHTYNTVIIGAGPAGLACATILARQGQKVIVFERNSTIGPKVCAGGIPFHALKRLQLPADLSEKSFPLQHLVTPLQQAKVKSNVPIVSTINRKKLGQFMSSQAINAGAEIRTNSSVRRISEGQVHTKEESFAYKYLVGADGSNSMVRRFLNIPCRSVGAGIQYQVPGDFQQMEWHFNPAIFKSGYAWIFPHKNRASIGIYADRDDIKPSTLKKALHNWAETMGVNLKGLQPEAALINFDYRGWHFDNIFLTGDAAGLGSGLTGEGILPAVISGEAVAKTILNPRHKDPELTNIIKKQRLHSKMQKLFARNKVICHITLEMLILALRLKIIPFRYFEMG